MIGFEHVEYDDFFEVIVRVRWSDGSERAVNPTWITTKD